MKVQIETRFGKKVEFIRQEKKWDGGRTGETFIESLVRCFYPVEYRRIKKAVAA